MTREEAKELLPIIQAFAVGKTIQYNCENENPQWIDVQPNEKVDFSQRPSRYRIKPESKYRPFANEEECWQEMQTHQPFGWIKDKKSNEYELLKRVSPKDGVIDQYACVFKRCVFADGTPFGIKEEE